MNGRHSLPEEVFALVEYGKPNNTETNSDAWTRLFTTPVWACLAEAHLADAVRGLRRERIEWES
jgi:hypothetical protein